MTPDFLQRATGCTAEAAARFAVPLTSACKVYGIDTPARLAAFLAQLAHESGALRWVAEIWGPTVAQAGYEGRSNLGNTQPGDGYRYRGRGLIQVTGRYNYAAATRRMRPKIGSETPDFEAHPDRLEDPLWACLSAGDYWQNAGLNALADAGEFVKIGRAINRGNAESSKPANGEADRLQRWERAKRAIEQDPGGAFDAPAAPIEDLKPTPVTRPKEKTVDPFTVGAGIGLIRELGGSLIKIFSPLAAEKLDREMRRHTDNDEVADQVAAGLIKTAQDLTGKADPIEAVAAAKQSPAMMQQIETSALDRLSQMAPLLEKLDALDRSQFSDEEASRDAAARRAQVDTMKDDMGRMLVLGGLFAMLALFLTILAIMIIETVRTGTASVQSWTLLGSVAGTVTTIVMTLYAYRFGSSRGSAMKDSAKDALMTEMTRRT